MNLHVMRIQRGDEFKLGEMSESRDVIFPLIYHICSSLLSPYIQLDFISVLNFK